MTQIYGRNKLNINEYLFVHNQGWESAIASILIDDINGNIANVDTATGTVTEIGNAGIILTDVAFSPTQQLFGEDFGAQPQPGWTS